MASTILHITNPSKYTKSTPNIKGPKWLYTFNVQFSIGLKAKNTLFIFSYSIKLIKYNS